jgi:hypothetical protein
LYLDEHLHFDSFIRYVSVHYSCGIKSLFSSALPILIYGFVVHPCGEYSSRGPMGV